MEATVKQKLYEGMFLVDSAEAADWDDIVGYVRGILEKWKAEIVSIKKWDDRRLAYDIKGTSKGTYILSYFRVAGESISGIERDVKLSERIMRLLILDTEQMTAEDIERLTPAMVVEKRAQDAAAKAAEIAEAKAAEAAEAATKPAEPEQSEESAESSEPVEGDAEVLAAAEPGLSAAELGMPDEQAIDELEVESEPQVGGVEEGGDNPDESDKE